jgi:hypothetical protein
MVVLAVVHSSGQAEIEQWLSSVTYFILIFNMLDTIDPFLCGRNLLSNDDLPNIPIKVLFGYSNRHQPTALSCVIHRHPFSFFTTMLKRRMSWIIMFICV